MGESEAQARFREASQLYTEGRYEEALALISELDYEFPGTINLLKAKARTLAKLGRVSEAIAVCDRLEQVFGYEKARLFRNQLEAKANGGVPTISFEPNNPTGADDLDDDTPAVEMTEIPSADVEDAAKKKRIRIKPVRLVLLLLIIAGMYFGYINYYVGGGIIAAYFIIKFGLKILFGAALKSLFSIPFKMKGKALDGATAELHSIEWAEKPKDADAGDDEDEPRKIKEPLRYAWLDVTITPQPRTKGFTHWEPGEIMIAPGTMKIRKLDDMDKCFRIYDIKIIAEDGQEQKDEGYKFHGPQRLKMLAEFPESAKSLKFYYYGFGFGDLAIGQ